MKKRAIITFLAGIALGTGTAFAAYDYEYRSNTGSRQPLWLNSNTCANETSGSNACSRLDICGGTVYSTPNRINTLRDMINKGPVDILYPSTFDVVCTAY